MKLGIFHIQGKKQTEQKMIGINLGFRTSAYILGRRVECFGFDLYLVNFWCHMGIDYFSQGL